MKVLIAEEDRVVAELVRDFLLEINPAIKFSDNPDLAFCNMGYDGTYGVGIIKSLNCPVIAMSGNPALRKIAEKAGARDFISKPFSFNHFKKVIQPYLK